MKEIEQINTHPLKEIFEGEALLWFKSMKLRLKS